ncbi:MAG TPA: glycosyltransferase family 4 protein [Anaerolineae bacterium]|nr:glycosyltransferase family 4 protein [Anaerolineae bacterium]
MTIIGTEPGESEAVERLRAAGQEVHVARLMQPAALRRWQRRWRLTSIWLRGQYPWRTVWFWEPEIQRILDRLLAERRFDLVIAEDSAMGVYHYRTQAPTLLTEHEVRRARPVDWHIGPPANWLRWAFTESDWQRWRRYQPAVWRRFDRIQVFTSRDADAISLIAPELADRVRVNPFSIDLPPQADHCREKDDSIVFIGNFTHAPNVDAALWLGHEIMPLLRARRPGVQLTLIGNYPPDSVKALACEDILVAGRVPEVEPYLEQAAAVLAPIRIGGGMRMKVLQGMALGKAVVTTPRGAEGLAIDGQPLPLAIATDAKGIASATIGLLACADARRLLGQQARAFVAEHYSAPAYARRLEAIYAEVFTNTQNRRPH